MNFSAGGRPIGFRPSVFQCREGVVVSDNLVLKVYPGLTLPGLASSEDDRATLRFFDDMGELLSVFPTIGIAWGVRCSTPAEVEKIEDLSIRGLVIKIISKLMSAMEFTNALGTQQTHPEYKLDGDGRVWRQGTATIVNIHELNPN